VKHSVLRAGLLAVFFATPAWVVAQPLPIMPPADYEQVGVYPAGSVNTVTYYSSVYGTNEQMMVYTPPGYNAKQKCGVIYAYQGISTGIDTIFDDWCVYAGAIADNLIGQGKIKPVIIVAVNDQINGSPSADTINCVIPYIDSHYSTIPGADHRGVYGYSWGGGYTFDIGCENLATFHHISPTSACVYIIDGDGTLFPNGGAGAKQVMKTLLLSCGTADWDGFYPGNQAIHEYCVSNDIPHGWLPVLGAGHDAGVWSPAMWNFLQMADAAGISDPSVPRSANLQNEAVNYDGQGGGGVPETCSDTGGGQDVGSIQNGNYLVFNNVDFGSGTVTNFVARIASAASGGNIQIRLDGTNGTLAGTCAVPGTGGWQTWVTESCSVSGITGVHNLYLKFTGGSGYLFNFEWWEFNFSSLPAPPAIPGGLAATAGVERAALKWMAAADATSYNVKRSTTSGGPYTNIANVAGTNYADVGVVGGATVIGGTTYYYEVSALDMGGESTHSAEVSVTPTVAVPGAWLTQDIGVGGVAGGASFSNGIFTVIGCGADIWNPSDQFRFAYLTATNNCTIIARVASASVEDINPWSKAGVMIRDSLDPGAATAFIGVTPGNGVIFQHRASDGGGSSSNSVANRSAPYWVKLARNGNTFTGSCSPDGVSWTQVGTTTFTMAATAYVGLADSSHDACTLSTATFDHVTGPGWAPPLAATPAGLTATAGVEQVALKWTASANATSYNLYRATTKGGPYTIVTNIATTNYNDNDLVGRTTYYYVVTAVNSLAGESGNSAQVSATPTVNVPLPWMTQDIGTVGLWGSAGLTNGVFTVAGSGDDIWNSADAFRFVYLTNSGNFTMVARIVSVQNIDPWSKTGVMIRDRLAPGAANAFIAVTPGNGVTWQYRSSDGGSCNNNTASGGAPYWIKLARSGTKFTGYCSANGTTWTQVGSTTLTNISTAYIGLAVTAHNNSYLCAATFDNVSAPGWPPPPLKVAATATSDTQVNLVWNEPISAASYNIKRSTISGGPYTLIARGITTTNYQNTGLVGGTIYYYVVSATVSGVESANSAQATATTFSPTAGSLVHRYSFSETGGVSVADSVGGPVWSGTLPNGGALSGGQLILSSISQQYVSLPGGLVSSLSNCTVMAWVNLASASNGSRVFDFGNDTNTYMFLTPQDGASDALRFAITTGGTGSEQQINGNSALSTGLWHQVAVTLNSGTGILYVDGAAVGTNSGMTINPSSLGGTVNNYLGKSQFASDPGLDGALEDFRIYNAGLSSAEIVATAALGSSQLLSTNPPRMGSAISGANLTLSWPLANAGFTLQSNTNLVWGNWLDVASAVPQMNSNQWLINLPASGNNASIYYRLIK
jgi:endo-1,4-beta-xylanase